MSDTVVVNLDFLIELARNGDGKLLAEIIRKCGLYHPKLRDFARDLVIDALEGKIQRPHKLTWAAARDRGWRERAVVRAVNRKMGNRRNTDQRTAWTKEFCDRYDTTADAVERFLWHPPKLTAAVKRRRSARK